jgi:hypothetical protein
MCRGSTRWASSARSGKERRRAGGEGELGLLLELWSFERPGLETCRFCFGCESARVDRASAPTVQRFLHAHHIDADKSDSHSSNIKLLCIRCHALQFQHAHVRENPDYSVFCKKFPKIAGMKASAIELEHG